MATIATPYSRAIPGYVAPTMVQLRFRLLREGEVTTGVKFLRLYRSWETISSLQMVFWAEAGSGEFTQTCSIELATLLAQGEWLACGVDDLAPRKTRAVYLSFSDSGTFTYNITSGDGAGNPGSPGVLAGRVRVDGLAADREVVVFERPSDGQWRLAGYGPTPGGDGAIDVRVVDGDVYAVALDTWGVGFQPNLVVTEGQTIRPTLMVGWVYRITEGGVLPATEPVWWPIDGDNASRPLGTARAVAVRYHQPLAHGPLHIEGI